MGPNPHTKEPRLEARAVSVQGCGGSVYVQSSGVGLLLAWQGGEDHLNSSASKWTMETSTHPSHSTLQLPAASAPSHAMAPAAASLSALTTLALPPHPSSKLQQRGSKEGVLIPYGTHCPPATHPPPNSVPSLVPTQPDGILHPACHACICVLQPCLGHRAHQLLKLLHP